MSKPMNLRKYSLACALASSLALASGLPCWAATQTVTNTNDSGSGSLRDAIAIAAPGDTIVFNLPNPSVITVSSTLIVNTNLSIQGPGAGQLAISGNQAVRVFEIFATVTISALTIENGHSLFGAGIQNSGTLTLANSVVSGNTATSTGGGIDNSGTLTVTKSTLSGNSANYGGGIENSLGTFMVTNSTFLGNSASSGGGGINDDNNGTITNSTLSGNSANYGGGMRATGNLTFKGTLLAGNQGGNCANFGFISQGYNLSDDNTCSADFTAASDKNNTPAGLDPNGLQNNGGPTPTIALLSTSPAVDAIPSANCTDTQGNPLTTDQRGIKRPQGAGCDIGAFELVQNTPFSYFSAKLAILTGKPSGFGLTAWFSLGATSNGIHPLSEAITLQIANYTVTIPAGSFYQIFNSPQAPYAYTGTINGTNLVVGLISLGNNNYQFDAAGSPVTWTGVKNPVTVSLTIGDDTGSTPVTAVIR